MSGTTSTTTQTQNSNITPSWDAKATIFGLGIITSNITDMGFDINFDLTFNNVFNFAPNVQPTNPRKMRYFCYGIGGKMNTSNNLTEAYRVSGLDGNLFSIIPCRIRPYEEDLSADEMAMYAGRVVATRKVAGVSQAYAFYYLKTLDKRTNQVNLVRNDSQTKTLVPYTPTVDCMSPSPLIADANGTITDVADTISTSAPVGLTIRGSDVLEVIDVLYNGDTRYANISEIGIVAADTQSLNALDANNKSFPYNEAIAAQLVTHSTTAGTQILGADHDIVKNVNLGLQNISIVIS